MKQEEAWLQNLKSVSGEGGGYGFEGLHRPQLWWPMDSELCLWYAVISGLLGRLLRVNSSSHLAKVWSLSSHCGVVKKRKYRDIRKRNLTLPPESSTEPMPNELAASYLPITCKPRMKIAPGAERASSRCPEPQSEPMPFHPVCLLFDANGVSFSICMI